MRYFYLVILFSIFWSSLVGQVLRTSHCIDCNKRDNQGTRTSTYFQSNLMNKYDIKYLKLDISVAPNSRFISGSCFYRVRTKQALDTFAIEFKQSMTLDSVFVNNTKRSFTRSEDHIYIAFSPSILTGTDVELKFFYNGNMGAGIASGTDASIGLSYTANVSESYQAREWFPAKQLLNDKIDSLDMWITTPAPNLAGSNGLLKTIVNLPDNKRQFQWSSRYPINYYLPSFAVGNYLDYRNYAKPVMMPNDSILIQHYIANNPAYFNSVKANLDKTPRFLEKMSELFGLYPFAKEKYGHAHANIGGGMEHQTISTMHSFSELLIAHELAHQWFGDNVTCASWSDIWINESFATYGNILMMEYLPALYPISVATEMNAVHEHIMSAPGGSVYVPAAEIYNEGRIFDSRLSYNKGSVVLHTLRFEMQSDTLFFNTLKRFQQRFKDTFASTTDFKQVAEEVTGRNFTDFFNQWIYGEGFPTYNVVYQKQGTDTLVLTINQTTSVPTVTPFFKGLMEYRIKSAQGDTTIKLNQISNNQVFKVYYPKTPDSVVVDPNNWVLNRVGKVTKGADIIISPVQSGLKIYPNPVRGSLNVRFTNVSFQSLQVIHIQGRILATYTIPTGASTFNTPLKVPRGMYFIRLIGANETVVEKILVK